MSDDFILKKRSAAAFIPRVAWLFLFFTSLLITGCGLRGAGTGRPESFVRSNDLPDFVAVVAGENDSFSSLAADYLHDADKGWLISEFNHLNDLHDGQEVIVPLADYARGGLSLDGYQTVPVLTYHNFSREKTDLMTVRERDFAEQMKFLHDNGYHVINLDDFMAFLDFKRQIPEKSVLITVDDGWRSFYDIAYPILRRYGFPATLFVYTDLITGGRKTLSWELIREMADNGIEIQCHTKTHRNMSVMREGESFKQYVEEINEELVQSAMIIYRKTGREVNLLAYPYGESNNLVIAMLKNNGYQGAFAVNRRSNPFFVHHYRIYRSMIYGDFDLAAFKKNLGTFRHKPLVTVHQGY